MMKVAQRMVTSFYVSISASASHRWTTLSALDEIGVRVTLRKITEHGQPSGVVLCAATSIWLPLPRQLFSISSKMKGKDHRFVIYFN